MTFDEKPVADITTGDIEAYRHHRRTQKRSAVTINHDLKLLRKMFAWGIRERLLNATPFRVAGEIEVPSPEPEHDDSRPQHDQSPAPSRAAASRADESAVR